MSTSLLTIGAVAAAVQFVLTGLAAVNPSYQPWPPDEISGRFGLYWLLVMAMAGPFFALLATTMGSLYAVGPVSIAGAIVFLAGATVNVLAADEFDGPEEILGLEWQVHTDGPFSFSRNPEVVGHGSALIGLAVTSGSWQALLLGTLVVSWFALRPHAEEPVLAEKHTDEYARYRARVARYLDMDRILRRCPPTSPDCPN
ncbi:methyltransferase [Halorubrum sp. RMP-47]|uniref:methyltransferase family protein n=1 Tax=Halorubrum miltondacostae TaxID=3076378 RepID=UPI0035282797